MTNREQQIFELIKQNPLISQQECADRIGISRSAVAGHIMNLASKGYIKGKGYILQGDPYVVVIGGSNIDVLGTPNKKFISRDSNPGIITLSPGGVGRNIAENLAKLGVSVKLLSAVGNDSHGKFLLKESRNAGIDIAHVLISESNSTSTYLAVLDEKHDMISAVSDMNIFDGLNTEYIKKNHSIIEGSSLIVVDTNLSTEVLNYLVEHYPHKELFLDTVSSEKVKKLTHNIGLFHTVKTNALELQALSGMPTKTKKEYKLAIKKLLEAGVDRIFLTLGEKGVYYADCKKNLKLKIKQIKPVNTSGAGDTFTAMLVYSYLKKMNIEKTLSYASMASEMTILHSKTINPELSIKEIEKRIKKRKTI